jgi:predicted dehydrogenase
MNRPPSDLAGLIETPRPLRPVRVAVVGLGKMGVAHTAVLSMIPEVELVGFSDHHTALGRSVRGLGHRAPFFNSSARMMEKTRPDAVFVCTQPDSHLAVARNALEAGAAVFVEKPLAHTLADAEALAELARERGKPVGCGYNLAFVPIFAAAHRVVSAGLLGGIRQARSSMYLSQTFGPRKGWMYDPARSGGGVGINLSSHLLFLLQWMLGPPVEARGTWSRFYGEVEDELHAMMKLAGGAEVGLDTSWSTPGYPFSAAVIEIEGERGKLLVSNRSLELDLAEPRDGWPSGITHVREADLPQPARFDVNGESYYLEDAAFLHWATGGTAPPNDVGAAVSVQRVLDAIYRSARDQGQVMAVAR